jgi:hypothetical protein
MTEATTKKELVLLAISSIFSAALLEVGLRGIDGAYSFRNFAALSAYPDTRAHTQLSYENNAYSQDLRVTYRYHSTLGWLPNRTGEPYAIYGSNTLNANDLILAVGDSMTMWPNYESPDSWPSQLSTMSDVPVINSAVGGFGVDQMYLYTKTLLETINPSTLVFAFIPDDVRRAELSVFHSYPKPYFVVRSDSLELHNVPVPRWTPSVAHMGLFRKIAGYSYAVHKSAIAFGFADRWRYRRGVGRN